MSEVEATSTALDTTALLDRLGGWQGIVDGAVPPLVFVAANALAGLLGYDEQALLSAAATAGTSALALGVARLALGQPLAGVLRGLVGLLLAVGLALWTGRARDFFLPGMVVDGIYAAVLTVSVLLGRPAVGCAYAALFGARAWRHDRHLQRVFATATLGWALVYGLRFSVQWLFYRNDEPELLALAKVGLGWPVTAAATILTVRAVRTAS
ncbi:DUF3159 domain-containing protein [Nocardioides bizhenqiangii]|uniref:DUF3159 domain-containing protein n=1 Tax=Nocardioides bizhenqiangii TaxID=3095076 RepID=A0ABZ0ZTY2_9ACTN|nr:DUF3159 domain-containing protein [Nocardioides sp. HM61]WQQ27778.1 DUF3159 domain-containing protein [Nocardioides sp. HM61]